MPPPAPVCKEARRRSRSRFWTGVGGWRRREPHHLLGGECRAGQQAVRGRGAVPTGDHGTGPREDHGQGSVGLPCVPATSGYDPCRSVRDLRRVEAAEGGCRSMTNRARGAGRDPVVLRRLFGAKVVRRAHLNAPGAPANERVSNLQAPSACESTAHIRPSSRARCPSGVRPRSPADRYRVPH